MLTVCGVAALTCNVLVLMYAVCWSAKHSQIGVNYLLIIIRVIQKNMKYDTVSLVLQVFTHNCNIMSSQCSSSIKQILEDNVITTKSTELMLAMSVSSKLKKICENVMFIYVTTLHLFRFRSASMFCLGSGTNGQETSRLGLK